MPSDQVARRLAQVLGEDEDLVLAWARARRRIPLRGVLEAASELLEDADVAAFARDEWFAATRAEAPPIRLRVPLLSLGADPGDHRMPEGRIGTVRIDVLPSDPPEAWLHPFAYGLARPNDAAPSRALAITRAVEHIDPRRRHVVRTAGGIVIGRAHWNGTHLVVFRDARRDDFLVLPAATMEALRERVAGVVMREIVVPQE